jgi:poly(A) polymerase
MVAFKLPPSRLIGEIKRALEAAVDAGEIEGRLESSAYVEFVGQHKQRFGIP